MRFQHTTFTFLPAGGITNLLIGNEISSYSQMMMIRILQLLRSILVRNMQLFLLLGRKREHGINHDRLYD